MAKFNVRAPEPAYGGKVGEVQFADGLAVIDDEADPGVLAYCRAQGYAVEAVEAEQVEVKAPAKTTRKAPAKADDKEGAGQ
jgi:hypothetical protein